VIHIGAAIAALPVGSVPGAAAYYRDRLGFSILHEDAGFAIVARGGAEIHLWHASDQGWRDRPDFATNPVYSGAESFLAGTASCRIAVDGIEDLLNELSARDVLLHGSQSVGETHYGTREFHAVDSDGNLLTFYSRAHRAGMDANL